jgi:hypothetical protein
MSIKAHMAPRMVKIKITNESPKEKILDMKKNLMFNDLRVSCGEIFVVVAVVVVLEGECL